MPAKKKSDPTLIAWLEVEQDRCYASAVVSARLAYWVERRKAISDDIHPFNEKPREWEDYYTYHRPHGAVDGQTPYERLMAKKSAAVSPGS